MPEVVRQGGGAAHRPNQGIAEGQRANYQPSDGWLSRWPCLELALPCSTCHPITKKCIDFPDGEIVFKGDYFRAEVEETPVPYRSALGDGCEALPSCFVRYWPLGEVVTSFAAGSLKIRELAELPSWNHNQLPGMYTLVADRDG